MKRAVLFALSALMALSLISCAPAESGAEGLRIVCTIFPEYDWTMNVLGAMAEEADVSLLLDSGVDLHSFQPSAADVVELSSADIFIYVGGSSDEWVEDALREAANPDMAVIDLMEVLGSAAVEEEHIEGMSGEEEHEEHGEAEYDEHVWLSVKNAALFTSAIADALSGLDPDNAAEYAENAEAYIEKLGALDARFEGTVESAARNTLLFADRFPFRYLFEDYGIEYFAAFAGCSAETEASFETVAFLAGKAKELALPSILVIDGGGQKLAETIIANTEGEGMSVLSLDSMQSIKAPDIAAGASYISIMEENLAVLGEALN